MKEKKIFLLLLLLLSCLPFLHSLTFPLLQGWDDHIYILANINKLSFSSSNIFYWFRTACEGCYLPFTMFSYMIDFSFAGLNPFQYRIHNLFWHLVAVSAVFQLLMLFTSNLRIAFFASLFFAIHPQRVESVMWISERKDVLCAAFYLWALYFSLKSLEEEKKTFIYLSLIFAIFAFLSKAMAVSLPFLILFCAFAKIARIDKRIIYKTIPFFFLSLIFIPLAILFQDIPQAHLSLFRRIAVVTFNIPWYFVKTFLPLNLSPIYPRIIPSTAKITGTIIFYICSILAIYYTTKRYKEERLRFYLFFLLSFLFALAPVSGLVPLGAIDYADRYSYIPSVFLIIFFAIAIEKHLRERKIRILLSALFSIYVLALSAITYFYSFSWSSYRAVLETAVSYKPPPYIAIGALADFEFFNGNPERITQLAKIAKERERGWESEKGVRKLFFKLDVLQLQNAWQSGKTDEASNIAQQINTQDIEEFMENDSDKNKLKEIIKQLK